MIIESSKTREFVIDIIIHGFFVMTFTSIIYILHEISRNKQELDDITKKVFEEIDTSEYITKPDKVEDDTILDKLSQIYEDAPFYDKLIGIVVNTNIISQIFILFIFVICIGYVYNKSMSFWRKFLFEKVIFFFMLISLELLFIYEIYEKYEEIKLKDIFEIVRKNIHQLN